MLRCRQNCNSAGNIPHNGVPLTLLTCCPTRSGRLEREYEVLGELGRGAFGSALKARRRADGCLVCLKALAWARAGRWFGSDHLDAR